MAVTNQQIIDYLLANPNLSDAQIVAAMEQNGISPSQMAAAVGIPEGQIAARVAATIPPNQTVQLGDTIVQPIYTQTGSGMDAQVGGLENVITYKAGENKVGGGYQQYTPTGELQRTGTQQKVASFTGGLVEALKDPAVLAALGGAAYGGLLGGGATGALGATEGLTLNELLPGANNLATATNVADVVGATEGGLLSGTPTGLSLAELSGTAGVTPAVTSAVTPATTGLLSTALPSAGTVGGALTSGALSALGGTAASGLLGSAITGGLGLAGGVVQQQQSKEAAQTAAQDIAKATQQAVEASQFRPVGMTTRFGTSNYTYDPVTGRMISAGYQLSPEAKAAQDRLVSLASRGLTQAEQAQAQFAPLQTAAQNLYSLGSQYIAKSPEEAAQDYINNQLQLLTPSRELDLANLQNKLFQQGRTGVSVAQGGTLGATTPELQALYNARAMQDLQLASQAQQEGRANTLFGSNLYDLGTAKLSNFYGGQTAAYQPYTTALGQIQNLESLGQQPLQMGAQLGQTAATAGANAGRMGLTGAQISSSLLTSPAVTNNPYAAFLGGLASPTSTLGQGLANYITGYNPTADQNAAINPYFTPTGSVWNV